MARLKIHTLQTIPEPPKIKRAKKEFNSITQEFGAVFKGKLWRSINVSANAFSFGFEGAEASMHFPKKSVLYFGLECGGSDLARRDGPPRAHPLVVFGSEGQPALDPEQVNPVIVSPENLEWEASFREVQKVTRIMAYCYENPLSISVDTSVKFGDEIANLGEIAFGQAPETVVFRIGEETLVYEVV